MFESCNGVDDDCNGVIDDGLAQSMFYFDFDGDGFGDPASSISACSAPLGTVQDDTDCDDLEPAINPSAAEVCNGFDDDCDTLIDNNPINGLTYFADTDNDGYGGAAAMVACSMPAGHATTNDDCDDNNPAVNPGATELCNGVDDDCNGVVDEGYSPMTFYTDSDNDGYGDDATAVVACSPPFNLTTIGGDCDDTNMGINPSASESCNGLDDDCDGVVDQGLLLFVSSMISMEMAMAIPMPRRSHVLSLRIRQ